MKHNYSKGVAILGHVELSFLSMGVLERALNTAVTMTDDTAEIRAIAELGESFGVDVTLESVGAEVAKLGESLVVDIEENQDGSK